MKSIKNLEGVQILSKKEMRNVDGGYTNCVRTSKEPKILYSPGTTSGPKAGELVAVGESCEWKCNREVFGWTAGGLFGTVTVERGC
jgi:hypothetical protein